MPPYQADTDVPHLEKALRKGLNVDEWMLIQWLNISGFTVFFDVFVFTRISYEFFFCCFPQSLSGRNAELWETQVNAFQGAHKDALEPVEALEAL